MATKKVNIDILARDKSKQALNGVRGNLDKLKKSIFNVRNAFIGLGAGLAIRSLINTGKQIEGLQVRLKFLFGSAEEGAKAFDEMAKFAAKVPFSLEQIQAGSGNLAVVAKDAKELAHLMEITGNVAAATGLDFQTTAEQVQRSLSAGISAADLFRDRGVKAMLGFKAGATASIKETAEAFDRVFGAGGKFGGTTDALANTLEGTLSMIGDSFFQFKRDILDAGFFPELKKQFGDLDEFLKNNEQEIQKLAKAIGENLAGALKNIVKFGKVAAENIELFGLAVAGMALILAPQITTIGLLATAVFKIAQAFDDAKMEAIGITKELDKQTWMELSGSVDKINKAMEKNIAIMKKYKERFEGVTDEEQLKHLELQLHILGKENTEYEMQIAFIQRLIKEKKDLGDAIVVETMAVKSLMEAEQEALQHTQKIQKEHAMFRKIALRDLAIINEEARVKELEAEKKHNLELKKIEEQRFKNNLAELKSRNFQFEELDKMSKENKKDLAKASGRELLGELAKSNKAAFAINKAFAIKDAIMNTAQGISKALAMGPFGIPLAVMIGGLGAVQVATIAQQEYTGRQLGGSVNKGQPYIVGESGREMFVPNENGKIVPNHDLKQGVNVNFNINTVDARGFNELLVNSRGVIVNLINSAVNEKGRAAII